MNGKRQLHGSFNHGSMANAMPQALGAQGAHPGRQVVSLSGDGGLSMLLGDLLTARQLKLPIKIVVYNNSLLGFVSMELKAAGYLDTNVDLSDRLRGDREGRGHLQRARRAFGERRGSAAHGVRARRAGGRRRRHVEVAAMPPKIELAHAKGFSLFMLRAILSGRGDEIVELARTNLR